jgi:glycosyltransferase involved in cell wall biosynthesis
MSVGLPIVSTTARGPADLLTGQPALLVPAEDATALRTAMKTAAASDRPVSYQLDRYHHERCAEELIAAYRFLLTRSDPPACVVRERPDTAGGPG